MRSERNTSIKDEVILGIYGHVREEVVFEHVELFDRLDRLLGFRRIVEVRRLAKPDGDTDDAIGLVLEIGDVDLRERLDSCQTQLMDPEDVHVLWASLAVLVDDATNNRILSCQRDIESYKQILLLCKMPWSTPALLEPSLPMLLGGPQHYACPP